MLPRRKSPTAASRANSPARLLSSSGSDGSLISISVSGCLIHNQTTLRPATTRGTYDRVAHPPACRAHHESPAGGGAGQWAGWATPTRTRRPDDFGLPFARWRVTVMVGYWVGGTPAHRITLSGWLNVPMGTRIPAGFFSHAS